jgi:hypothetical protein
VDAGTGRRTMSRISGAYYDLKGMIGARSFFSYDVVVFLVDRLGCIFVWIAFIMSVYREGTWVACIYEELLYAVIGKTFRVIRPVTHLVERVFAAEVAQPT